MARFSRWQTTPAVSDSDSSWEECACEGLINPIAEAKRLGANLTTPGKAKIARERKIQTNAAGKKRRTREQNDLNRNKTNLKCKHAKTKSNISANLSKSRDYYS